MIKREIRVEITPKESAETFSNWNNEEQAEFFHHLSALSWAWSPVTQLAATGRVATPEAKGMMRLIGAYGSED